MESNDSPDLFAKFNIEAATPGEVSHDLRGCLSSLRKPELDIIAKHYEIPRRTKLKKEELITRLYDTLSCDAEIERKLLISSHYEWDFWHELYQSDVIQDNSKGPGYYIDLMMEGLLYLFEKNGFVSFVIPDQIKMIHRRLIKNGLKDKRDRYMLVFDYATALTNLYGACSINMLYDTLVEQNDIHMEYAEFLHIFSEYLSREQNFDVHNGYIIDYMLVDDDYMGFEELLEKTEGKPYCKLSGEELLKFSGDFVCEQTPELFDLIHNIASNLHMDKDMAKDLAEEIAFYSRMDLEPAWHLEVFESRHLKFEDIHQAREIIRLIGILSNSIRKWINRGYSPNEAHQNVEPEIKNITIPVSASLLNISADKIVGRNDPCPCGSGKKFKKCCGSLN